MNVITEPTRIDRQPVTS